ncbi:MAG: 1-(5-phosphoribosyl)-5-[(5-phosphoribosylamino)methylideneamino]imidazole-4-carboxamide isomerase [Oscillospiraceae bacterium]|jgi:phosphoribosylformimino-5-aminoimidazole carboxamide ribotide isomerase|nr:1-(5-phosphoribosyl)-5-[(5-phosphoribosylamino)methylideneamino]imidazole-4-carboxamide isomerase [Oscillospiraceae bacterium]
MLIFPAIDLKDGKAVRLRRGDFSTVHQVADDPLETARTFCAAGARYLHMVDLDGARDGIRKNSAIVRAAASAGLRIELGGGIRSSADLEAVFALGVWRAVIGSAAVSRPDFVREALAAWGPERIAVGVDAKDGLVRTAGWEENAGVDYLAFARQMEDLGVRHIIFTDIDTDGVLAGPAFDRLEALQKTVSCAITASGGVSSNADLRALRDQGLYAAIVGKAWYAGAVDLAQAVEEGGPQ